MKLTAKLFGLCLVIGLVMAMPVRAAIANPFQHPAGLHSSSANWLAKVTIEEAIGKAKEKYGGKVLSAKEIESKGPLVYKIKLLLPNGRVKTVFVDGESGEVFEA